MASCQYAISSTRSLALALLEPSPSPPLRRPRPVGRGRSASSTPSGETLVEQTQYTPTGATKVRDRPGADCFGPGTGGSGDRADVPGATALGQLTDDDPDRSRRQAPVDHRLLRLRPRALRDRRRGLAADRLLVPEASTTSASQLGGDQTQVENGDVILWYLIEDFNQPAPDELVLTRPGRRRTGEGSVRVKVSRYADGRSRQPRCRGRPSPAPRRPPTRRAGRPSRRRRSSSTCRRRCDEHDPLERRRRSARSRPRSAPRATRRPIARHRPERTGSRRERAAETILAGGGDDAINVRPRATRTT